VSFLAPHPVMAILDITIKLTPLIENLKANHDTVAFIKRYNKLFKKYIRVILLSAIMETYIVYSDKVQQNFGEKKTV
jgi:hypothetical protein